MLVLCTIDFQANNWQEIVDVIGRIVTNFTCSDQALILKDKGQGADLVVLTGIEAALLERYRLDLVLRVISNRIGTDPNSGYLREGKGHLPNRWVDNLLVILPH